MNREKAQVAPMVKVVCQNCGKTRYWFSADDSESNCWECDGKHTFTDTELSL